MGEFDGWYCALQHLKNVYKDESIISNLATAHYSDDMIDADQKELVDIDENMSFRSCIPMDSDKYEVGLFDDDDDHNINVNTDMPGIIDVSSIHDDDSDYYRKQFPYTNDFKLDISELEDKPAQNIHCDKNGDMIHATEDLSDGAGSGSETDESSILLNVWNEDYEGNPDPVILDKLVRAKHLPRNLDAAVVARIKRARIIKQIMELEEEESSQGSCAVMFDHMCGPKFCANDDITDDDNSLARNSLVESIKQDSLAGSIDSEVFQFKRPKRSKYALIPDKKFKPELSPEQLVLMLPRNKDELKATTERDSFLPIQYSNVDDDDDDSDDHKTYVEKEKEFTLQKYDRTPGRIAQLVLAGKKSEAKISYSDEGAESTPVCIFPPELLEESVNLDDCVLKRRRFVEDGDVIVGDRSIATVESKPSSSFGDDPSISTPFTELVTLFTDPHFILTGNMSKIESAGITMTKLPVLGGEENSDDILEVLDDAKGECGGNVDMKCANHLEVLQVSKEATHQDDSSQELDEADNVQEEVVTHQMEDDNEEQKMSAAEIHHDGTSASQLFDAENDDFQEGLSVQNEELGIKNGEEEANISMGESFGDNSNAQEQLNASPDVMEEIVALHEEEEEEEEEDQSNIFAENKNQCEDHVPDLGCASVTSETERHLVSDNTRDLSVQTSSCSDSSDSDAIPVQSYLTDADDIPLNPVGSSYSFKENCVCSMSFQTEIKKGKGFDESCDEAENHQHQPYGSRRSSLVSSVVRIEEEYKCSDKSERNSSPTSHKSTPKTNCENKNVLSDCCQSPVPNSTTEDGVNDLIEALDSALQLQVTNTASYSTMDGEEVVIAMPIEGIIVDQPVSQYGRIIGPDEFEKLQMSYCKSLPGSSKNNQSSLQIDAGDLQNGHQVNDDVTSKSQSGASPCSDSSNCDIVQSHSDDLTSAFRTPHSTESAVFAFDMIQSPCSLESNSPGTKEAASIREELEDEIMQMDSMIAELKNESFVMNEEDEVNCKAVEGSLKTTARKNCLPKVPSSSKISGAEKCGHPEALTHHYSSTSHSKIDVSPEASGVNNFFTSDSFVIHNASCQKTSMVQQNEQNETAEPSIIDDLNALRESMAKRRSPISSIGAPSGRKSLLDRSTHRDFTDKSKKPFRLHV